MITYRTAEISDAADIAAVSRNARINAMPWLPVLHTIEQDTGFFQRRVLPSHTVCAAVDGGKIIGFCATKDDWIDHLYIDMSHWRRGIGSEFIALAKAGQGMLQLWAFQGNTDARAFYAAHGFREVEQTDGRNNQEKTPDVRFEWHS